MSNECGYFVKRLVRLSLATDKRTIMMCTMMINIAEPTVVMAATPGFDQSSIGYTYGSPKLLDNNQKF